MFTLSTAHGVCPYDGFWIHSDELPKASFVAGLKPRQRRFIAGSPWRYFFPLSCGGGPGSLKIMWGLRLPYEGAPSTRVYINPSTAGLSANDVLELLSTILDNPLEARIAQLDTKVDVEGTYWRVAAHIYMPYVRYKDHWDFPGTAYEGKRTRLTVYQKAGWHDDFPKLIDVDDDAEQEPSITRVEIRQRLRKQKRPTVLEFLRGDCMETNLMRRLRVVKDLEKLGDRVLAEEALKMGLTKAVREYASFASVSVSEIKATKALVNDVGTIEIYHLYCQTATAWHAQFISQE